jgi:hypothetical protein
MLRQAAEAGVRAAKLAYFGENIVNKGVDAAKYMAVGQAPQVFVEGPKTFAPGGTMHWRNVMWPTIPGSPGKQMLGRAGSLLSLGMLPGMMSRDKAQGESGLSSALGSAGSLAGLMYGGTAGGVLGSPIGAALGHRAGLGLGHLLGGKPKQEQGL